MKKLLLPVLLGFWCGLAVEAADKPAGALPTVDQLLEKQLKAVGGKEAALKLKSRVIKASLEVPAMGATVTAEFQSKAPNKTLNVIEIPGVGTIREGFDGTMGWSQNPFTGLSEKSATEVAAIKRQADFYRDIRLRELYPKMTVTGSAKVGGHDTYVVEATPAEGGTDKLYFAADSGLVLRMDSTTETPAGKLATEIYFEDHRDVDGVKIPFTIRQPEPSAAAFTVKITEVKHNATLDDALFLKPAAAK